MAAAQNELLFALVARGKEVLAEYTPSSGNFTVVTRMLLTKFPEKDGRMSYRYDRSVTARTRTRMHWWWRARIGGRAQPLSGAQAVAVQRAWEAATDIVSHARLRPAGTCSTCCARMAFCSCA